MTILRSKRFGKSAIAIMLVAALLFTPLGKPLGTVQEAEAIAPLVALIVAVLLVGADVVLTGVDAYYCTQGDEASCVAAMIDLYLITNPIPAIGGVSVRTAKTVSSSIQTAAQRAAVELGVHLDEFDNAADFYRAIAKLNPLDKAELLRHMGSDVGLSDVNKAVRGGYKNLSDFVTSGMSSDDFKRAFGDSIEAHEYIPQGRSSNGIPRFLNFTGIDANNNLSVTMSHAKHQARNVATQKALTTELDDLTKRCFSKTKDSYDNLTMSWSGIAEYLEGLQKIYGKNDPAGAKLAQMQFLAGKNVQSFISSPLNGFTGIGFTAIGAQGLYTMTNLTDTAISQWWNMNKPLTAPRIDLAQATKDAYNWEDAPADSFNNNQTVASDKAQEVTSQFANKTVNLKSVETDKYVCGQNNSTVHADGDCGADNKGVYQTVLTADGWLGFRLQNGKWLSVQSLDYLRTEGDNLSSWECFKIYKKGNDYFLLSQKNNKYVQVTNAAARPLKAARLYSDGLDGATWERFQIEVEGGNNNTSPSQSKKDVFVITDLTNTVATVANRPANDAAPIRAGHSSDAKILYRKGNGEKLNVDQKCYITQSANGNDDGETWYRLTGKNEWIYGGNVSISTSSQSGTPLPTPPQPTQPSSSTQTPQPGAPTPQPVEPMPQPGAPTPQPVEPMPQPGAPEPTPAPILTEQTRIDVPTLQYSVAENAVHLTWEQTDSNGFYLWKTDWRTNTTDDIQRECLNVGNPIFSGSYIDYNVEPGVTYSYQLQSVTISNERANAGYGNIINIDVPYIERELPVLPNYSLAEISAVEYDGNVRLSSAGVNVIFQRYFGKDEHNNEIWVNLSDTIGVQFTDVAVIAGRTYYYRVYDVSAGGSSDWKAITVPHNNIPFFDVNYDDWYYEYVEYVNRTNVMTGDGDGRFSPKKTLTRAEAITIIARLSGADMSQYQGYQVFSDVPANHWSAPYVAWAYDNGVTAGIGDNKFGSSLEVTQSQMDIFLQRLYGLPENVYESSNSISRAWAAYMVSGYDEQNYYRGRFIR